MMMRSKATPWKVKVELEETRRKMSTMMTEMVEKMRTPDERKRLTRLKWSKEKMKMQVQQRVFRGHIGQEVVGGERGS